MRAGPVKAESGTSNSPDGLRLVVVGGLLAGLPALGVTALQLVFNERQQIHEEVRQSQRESYDRFLRTFFDFERQLDLYQEDLARGRVAAPKDDFDIPQPLLRDGLGLNSELVSLKVFGSEEAAARAEELLSASNVKITYVLREYLSESEEDRQSNKEILQRVSVESAQALDALLQQVRQDVKSNTP